MLYASIITIGDELLIGQVVDTNSAWMAQELNKAGVALKHRVAVGDVWDDIWHSLDEESKYADLILITGGLGPTADDITKPLLCEYFGGKLIVDAGALQNVQDIFQRVLKRPMIERNLKQAEVPDNCTVIQNKRGTAPGMMFHKDGKIFVSMPGVPHEMKGMMTESVIPLLPEFFKTAVIRHRTMLTVGIGESFLADRIHDFEEQLPANIKLAYLPNYGMVRLRLTATGDNAQELETALEARFATLKQQLADVMATDEDISLQQKVGQMLVQQKKTLATAESCTGGYIAHLVTSMPGSSAWYQGTVVSYANDVKVNLLGVQPSTLAEHGAVSEATVREMARGAITRLDTDYAIATSGIMGPDGGTAAKPVGLVWIAVADRSNIVARQFNFRFDRLRNIELTANNAFNMLREMLRDAEANEC